MGKLRINKLREQLAPNKKNVIYGIGNFATKYYKELIQNGIQIEYCLVTKKETKNVYFNGLAVYSIEEKIEDIKNNDVMILILVSDSFSIEIKDMLDRYGLEKYLVLADLIRQPLENQKKIVMEEDWIGQIAEWYADEEVSRNTELKYIKEEIVNTINAKKNEKKVIFLIGHMSPRVIKMISALNERGYDILVLFYLKEILNNPIYEELKKITRYYYCEYIEEMLYQIIQSRAKIVHVFSNYNNGSLSMAYLLVRIKSILPLIVFEQYDIANGMYCSLEDKVFQEEKFCLEHSDGICCRGNEIDFLLDEINFDIKAKIIKFFDYIGDDLLYSKNDEELSLCYAGHFITEKERPNFVYSCMLEFARMCENNHCHFHLYPSTWDEERYKEYIKLSQKSNYFHFYKPVPYKNLLKKLSQFDYEVIPSKEGFLNKEENGTYTSKKIIYSTTNKFFDGLEAGLPIIAAFPLKLANYFEANGVLLNWTIEEIDFEQLRKRKVELKKNVEKFRERLRIRFRILELIEFYNSL